MDKKELREYVAKVAIALSLMVVAALILKYSENLAAGVRDILNIVKPFIFGACIAYIMLPLCNKIEHWLREKHIKKPFTLSIIISEAVLITVVTLVICIVLPQGIESVGSIMNKLPEMIDRTEANLHEYMKDKTVFLSYVGYIQDEATELVKNKVSPMIEKVAEGIISGTMSFGTSAANMLFGVIISIFVLFNRRSFSTYIKRIIYTIFGARMYDEIILEALVIDKMFSGFLYGKAVDSLIVGAVCMLTLSILDMPYALIVSLIVGITNMIPIAGPFIGAIPGTIIIFSESPIKSLYFVIFIIILQQIDGHIIGPKCIGNATGLNTFWVLFAIIFFGKIWGIGGMLIGVPLMAVILDIFDKVLSILHDKRLELEEVKYPDD